MYTLTKLTYEFGATQWKFQWTCFCRVDHKGHLEEGKVRRSRKQRLITWRHIGSSLLRRQGTERPRTVASWVSAVSTQVVWHPEVRAGRCGGTLTPPSQRWPWAACVTSPIPSSLKPGWLHLPRSLLCTSKRPVRAKPSAEDLEQGKSYKSMHDITQMNGARKWVHGRGGGGTMNETHTCLQCTPTAGLRVKSQNTIVK